MVMPWRTASGCRPTKDSVLRVEHVAVDDVAPDRVGAVEHDQALAVARAGLHRVQHRVDERVVARADVLHVEDERVDAGQHLRRRHARLAVEAVHGQAGRAVARVADLDQVLRVGGDPVLGAEERAQLHAAPAVERDRGVHEVARDRGRVDDQARPQAADEARAARAAVRARRRRAASPLLHELERERDRRPSGALDVAGHGVALERPLEAEGRALQVGGEAHVAPLEADLAQRRAQLDDPRQVVSVPASLPPSPRSWTVNSRLPRSGSSIVPSQRPSTATAARRASPETTSAACRSAGGHARVGSTTLVGTVRSSGRAPVRLAVDLGEDLAARRDLDELERR